MKKLVLALAAVLAMSAFACKKEEKADPAKPVDPAVKPVDPAVKPVEPAAAGGEMPPACKEYAEKMDKCLASDKFPAAAKEQTAQAFKAMRDGWGTLGALPAEQKDAQMKAADDACTQAIAGMKAAGDTMCAGVW
jgi:hypothetical protein